MNLKIEEVIVKYLSNSATVSDLNKLSEWIEKPINRQVFRDYVETHVAINYNMNNPETEKVIHDFLEKIKKEKTILYRLKKNGIYKYAVAACLILALSLSYFLGKKNDVKKIDDPEIVDVKILPGTDKATLTLEDGTIVELSGGKSLETQNLTSNGDKLVYKQKKERTSQIKYNFLTIPRGGQFFIILSDGTKVWLNSESQLRYPVHFIKGEVRKVELVYGEAYFDVSSSENHQGSKFIVNNRSQDVEVLGTEFNIKAYQDETNVYTTLVEGKVVVNFPNGKQDLIPNQQSNLNTISDNMTINQVDVRSEIAWKNGVFSFKGKPLKEIMKVISRWYDVDVIFENKDLESIKFKGSLEKNQSLEEILSIMQSSTLSSYEMKDKTLILK